MAKKARCLTTGFLDFASRTDSLIGIFPYNNLSGRQVDYSPSLLMLLSYSGLRVHFLYIKMFLYTLHTCTCIILYKPNANRNTDNQVCMILLEPKSSPKWYWSLVPSRHGGLSGAIVDLSDTFDDACKRSWIVIGSLRAIF